MGLGRSEPLISSIRRFGGLTGPKSSSWIGASRRGPAGRLKAGRSLRPADLFQAGFAAKGRLALVLPASRGAGGRVGRSSFCHAGRDGRGVYEPAPSSRRKEGLAWPEAGRAEPNLAGAAPRAGPRSLVRPAAGRNLSSPERAGRAGRSVPWLAEPVPKARLGRNSPARPVPAERSSKGLA
jgi:hypothetical protein